MFGRVVEFQLQIDRIATGWQPQRAHRTDEGKIEKRGHLRPDRRRARVGGGSPDEDQIKRALTLDRQCERAGGH